MRSVVAWGNDSVAKEILFPFQSITKMMIFSSLYPFIAVCIACRLAHFVFKITFESIVSQVAVRDMRMRWLALLLFSESETQ